MKPKRLPLARVLKAGNDTRRDNLRAMVGTRFDNQAALAKALDCTESYLSQLIGPKPRKPVTEKTARKFEHKLRLDVGALDRV